MQFPTMTVRGIACFAVRNVNEVAMNQAEDNFDAAAEALLGGLTVDTNLSDLKVQMRVRECTTTAGFMPARCGIT